ncbi:MAG: bifunctional N-acetylglucosamine-1-phosphate uridyltransferase/glucosamine-1-phosphate acetyltransferase [Planctomycetes bacterium]|nr:bifunctional N-acetylglucosamine-1-phosphate uridyltransferase/glucosamine-1-phosphate acetyltransferase [Planctomycetota bacterium]
MLVTVILAAGKGTRMCSELPKVLHPLLGVPVLEHSLESAEALGPGQKIVVVGYAREKVIEAFQGRGITWAVQEEQLGTAHAARCGIGAIGAASPGAPPAAGADPDVLVLNGDLPALRADTLRALLAEHARPGAHVSILTCSMADPSGYGRILRDARGLVTGIVEEKDAEEATRRLREVNVGTYVFRASAFREAYARIDRQNAQGELYLTDVVVQAARGGRTVATFEVEDEREVAQVNSRAELARASEILRERMLDEYMGSGVTIDDPGSTYIEKGVRIGAGTRILPFTVIQRGVEIGAGCEVGPFTHLRPGTRLADGVSVGNFVEVKASRIGRKTKVRHLSYVGDGIVGEGVNIGAGTIFANYDGKTKSTTVVKDGAFIGSGTVLVAPVTVGARAVTGAGSVVLKNRDVGDGEVVVGVPAKALKKA